MSKLVLARCQLQAVRPSKDSKCGDPSLAGPSSRDRLATRGLGSSNLEGCVDLLGSASDGSASDRKQGTAHGN